MKINSLYITQSAVISLADIPLEVKENIGKSFDPIFKSRKCFEDMGVDIEHLKNNEIHDDAPFINHMGQLCFNERSVGFFFAYPDYEEYWDYRVFGCNKELKDQRMNFLYFELRKPFKLLAQYGGKTVASGKIFLHVYPAGYIVVYLAVYRRNLKNIDIKAERDILDLMHETKPWINGKWKWKSKFGCNSLKETFEQVFHSISKSLLTKGKIATAQLEWKAGVAMTTDLSNAEISQAIMTEKAGSHYFVEVGYQRYREAPGGILVIKNRINYYFADYVRERDLVLHSFWKINHVNEFLSYKSKVYSDYLKYIQKDINEMRELKLNKEYRFKIANIVGKNFYNNTFFPYTQALDEYTTMLGSRYRAIYALLSKTDGFDKKRERLNQALERWEADITEWQSKDKGLMKLLSLILDVKNLL